MRGELAPSLLRALRRQARLVVACAILTPAAALGVSFLQETQYGADATLLFRDPAFDQTLFGSTFFSPGSDPARAAATNVKLVSREPVVDRTARQLGRTSGEVRESIDVFAEGQSDLVTVRGRDPDPDSAAKLANTFATVFIEYRAEADRSKLDAALKQLQARLAQLNPDARASPGGRQLRARSEELETLAALQTGNAELVQPAEPPTSAISPRPVRNTLIGVVMGALLGIGLALLVDRLDRRMKDPDEVTEAFGQPLLAAIPESTYLASPNGRMPTARGSDAEAFRILRANLRYFNVSKEIRCVAVISAAPSDGKSIVSLNLSFAAAEADMKVLLIEADLRRPGISGWTEHSVQGLSTVLAADAKPADVIQPVSRPPEEGSDHVDATIDLLPAGPLPPNPAEMLGSVRMQELLRDMEQQYDLVVVDTAPALLVSDAIPLVKRVQGIIIVSRLFQSDRNVAARLRTQLEQLDAPVLGVVVNAARIEQTNYAYGYGAGAQPA